MERGWLDTGPAVNFVDDPAAILRKVYFLLRSRHTDFGISGFLCPWQAVASCVRLYPLQLGTYARANRHISYITLTRLLQTARLRHIYGPKKVFSGPL